jgi:ferredoxin
VPYEVHYAVRSVEEAAFLDWFPKDKVKVYAKIRNERLDINTLIPNPSEGVRIYCCGPSRLMDATKSLALSLGYENRMLHFKSFGVAAGGPQGEPFEAEVNDLDTGRHEKLEVPSDRTLLQTLRKAGFDMTSFCETGACGACKVALCEGKASHWGTAPYEKEQKVAMLSCVDRGLGRIRIELN